MKLLRILTVLILTVLSVAIAAAVTLGTFYGMGELIGAGAGEDAPGSAGLIPFVVSLALLPFVAEIGFILCFFGLRVLAKNYVLHEKSYNSSIIDTAITTVVVTASIITWWVLYGL